MQQASQHIARVSHAQRALLTCAGGNPAAGIWAAKIMGLGASRVGAYGEPDAEHAAPLFAPKLRNDFGMADGPGKMILVVNGELKMGKGKIAAQVTPRCPTVI